jgi:hypothetical protein
MTNTYSGQQPTALAENAQPAYYSNQAAGYPAAPGYPPAYPQSVPATDPARTLGIAGLVLSVFTSVVGLIVSIVAFRKSKRAGFKNGAALAGIVVGAITTLGILTAGIAAGVAATSLVNTCQDLGPGTHVVNGVTYTCG